MKTVMVPGKRTRLIAGTIAALASFLSIGGPMVLAEHYAQTGASGDASGYYAAGQIRRSTCQDNGNSHTAAVSAKRSVENFRHELAA